MFNNLDNKFDLAYKRFKLVVEHNSGKEFIDFKTNSYVDSEEGYKYQILVEAKNALIRNTWKSEDIGSGKIIEFVKKALPASVRYKGKRENNNIIDWRHIEYFKKKSFSTKEERLLFEFFKSKRTFQECFISMDSYGYPYQLIAYFFFINNHQTYCPLSQEMFDRIFKSLGIDFQTSRKKSWENYTEFNLILKNARKFLSKKFKNITLLDAHSFLYIYGVNDGLDVISNGIYNTNKGQVDAKFAITYPDDLNNDRDLFEGIKKRITVNSYERNSEARKQCIEHYKAICSVCSFDFYKKYGEVGRGFIHVHHLKQLSDIQQGYEVKPIIDLRPVCPNCHAMLHKKNPPYTIEELKNIIKT